MYNKYNNLTKQDLSILIGNSLDHFDTAIYGFLAPILAPLFFPNHTPIVQLILAYSVFTSSAITRPIGALIFGVLAKRYGPLIALSNSLIGIAITTVSIGVLPTYDAFGFMSPTLLIILRAVSGIFASGEATIASLYIIDNKVYSQAFKVSYLYQTSTIFGIIIASATGWLVIAYNHDLWRLCFIFGGCTGFIGYALRKYYTDNHVHEKTNHHVMEQHQSNIASTLLHNRVTLLKIAITSSFSYMTYYIVFVVMNSFIPLITSISLETMMMLNTSLLLLDMIMIPIIGKLTLRYQPRKLMTTTSLLLTISIIPLWYGLYDASLVYVTIVRIWIVILGIIFICPLNIWYKQTCNSQNQYIIVGIGNSLASAVTGRLTPMICLWLWYTTNTSITVACYIIVISIATIWAV